ncbi:MAG: aspartate carbamoyltransferase catalytic subunit [Candidatus Marinimicrobia bacterium]|jgi:aspartate carbamoyltransferase catalytic subunit|nr:aspartate carbamoyltransferase catalytic subunit [Candidatus Neomarinimicrobiota bacterium]MCK9559972.1 aspartate carbamoyltransferase catalytic subunit [Candidatus Neomarinimicrobiota bacterium]
MNLSIKHLLGLEGVPRADISAILDAAFSFREVLERPIKRVPTLQGKTIVNLFFENSTRTRISFELAEKRLSADTVNFSSSGSSLAKGESLKDTIRNLFAMKMDAVVMRHSAPGSVKLLSQFVDAVVINAGDGAHEHPTQALLDMMSLQEKYGSLDGLNVAIIGDILHSRVALSNIYGLLTMGANVALCGPPTFIPVGIESLGVKVIYNLDEALDFADAINVLRIQRERQGKGFIPSLREYRAVFGITRERLDKLHKTITIMHPGPINRGVEIDSDIADSEHSIILHQVLNGVAVRMAVLFLLLGGK